MFSHAMLQPGLGQTIAILSHHTYTGDNVGMCDSGVTISAFT